MVSNLDEYKLHFRNFFNSNININCINFNKLPKLVAQTMEAVNQYKILTGEQKRILVLDVLTRAIKDSNVSDLKKEIAINQLDSMIETFICVSKGAVNVSKKDVFDPKTSGLIKISEKVYNEVRKTLDDDKITIRELVKIVPLIVTSVIKVLNKVKRLNGGEKKTVAIYVTNKIIDEINIPRETDKDKALIKFYKKSASSLINTSVAVATGKININDVVEVAKVCFGICKIFCK
jgi:hypothetical protein